MHINLIGTVIIVLAAFTVGDLKCETLKLGLKAQDL
jgi:hypothetical protein